MVKRFVSLIAASLLLVVVFLPTVAHAQSTAPAPPQSTPSLTQSIWAGLRQGSSLAFGSPTTPPTQPPTNPGTPPPTGNASYVALGDSVAAGLGLPADAGTSGQPTQCGRSAEAYPYRVAAARNLTVMNIACSGATAGDLFTVQGVSGPNIPAQLTTAFANGTPQLMTITAGANDIHWAAFLKKCAASTCGTASDSSIANIYMTVLKFKLHYALSSIQARSHGTPPTVVMTGYYNPVSAACNSIDARFTPSELAWFSGEVAALNQTIQNVSSQYSFARFAPVDFTGHDLCSADSWVQGLQDPAPIHPTAAGQAAIANAVLTKL